MLAACGLHPAPSTLRGAVFSPASSDSPTFSMPEPQGSMKHKSQAPVSSPTLDRGARRRQPTQQTSKARVRRCGEFASSLRKLQQIPERREEDAQRRGAVGRELPLAVAANLPHCHNSVSPPRKHHKPPPQSSAISCHRQQHRPPQPTPHRCWVAPPPPPPRCEARQL
jgi:hypothetical protein